MTTTPIDARAPRALEIREIGELPRPQASASQAFATALADAVGQVEELQQQSAAAQVAFARGEPVELHDVLIRIEEAEIAFKAMMEIRNKLIGSYQEIMRMGGGG